MTPQNARILMTGTAPSQLSPSKSLTSGSAITATPTLAGNATARITDITEVNP